jgi:tetratricopeptide (TPR) repeat protein
MQTIVQLQENIEIRPNSIEVSEALANEYVKQQRWEEAVNMYQSLLSLYPATASLFVNRIRLGATALAISSALVLAKELIQPALIDFTLHPTAFAQELSSTNYLSAQILVLLAFPLFSTAAISIYKLLSYTHDHRPAFWAMVFSVIGVGLSMPSLGIRAIVLPLIARLYLAGELNTFSIYRAMQAMPWSLILNLGSYIFVLGIAIFCWVILRNNNFPKLPAILFLAGWFAFLAFVDGTSKLNMILTGTLIWIGGIGLAISVWTQAPLQFKPLTAPIQKADS